MYWTLIGKYKQDTVSAVKEDYNWESSRLDWDRFLGMGSTEKIYKSWKLQGKEVEYVRKFYLSLYFDKSYR